MLLILLSRSMKACPVSMRLVSVRATSATAASEASAGALVKASGVGYLQRKSCVKSSRMQAGAANMPAAQEALSSADKRPNNANGKPRRGSPPFTISELAESADPKLMYPKLSKCLMGRESVSSK